MCRKGKLCIGKEIDKMKKGQEICSINDVTTKRALYLLLSRLCAHLLLTVCFDLSPLLSLSS